jgi:NADPH:quinone reductase-like Zn-dependent oxidoreductase
MKAAQINEYGGVDAIKVVETDKPAIKDDQVLVEVHAASLNPFDTAVREGRMRSMKELDMPVTLGGDIAGVIADLGENVSGFLIGDKVYGQASVFGGGSGAFAEFATTKAVQIAKMPNNSSFEQAASLPLTGVAALQGLREHLDLQSGQKILIQGGSGGIGTMAIPLAKHFGAYVATTVPPEGIAYAKELGADEVIDYKSQNFSEIVRDYDAVFDLVGRDTLERSIDVLKPSGKAVSTVSKANEEHAKQRDVTTIYQGTKVTTEALNQLRELIEKDVLNQNVDKTFSLGEIQKAFKAREEDNTLGKIVIKIK